jgi:3-hydroxyacyl-CoA dehydrogenase
MSSNLERLLQWHRRKLASDFASPRSKAIASTAIVGAGLMGIEIAAANLSRGLRVVLTDNDSNAMASAIDRISIELAKYGQRAEGFNPSADDASTPDMQSRGVKPLGSLSLLELSRDEDRLCRCDLILEAVTEKLPIKQRVFEQLEPRLSGDSILATNTSTIPVGELATELARPERFCGVHFCHPVHINPLVEIIPGPKTSPETTCRAVDYAKTLGKLPLVVEDGPGFLVNRLLMRYTQEAMHLVMDGAGIEEVDRAAERFGMALGPFRIMDEIGLDTSLAAGKVLQTAFPDRVATLPLLPLLVKRKQLGQKTGGGFYDHSSEPAALNPVALQIAEHYARRDNRPSEESIQRRLLLAMIHEATLIMAEKSRLDPREIDLCMVCGLGFPIARGGLLYWADEIGSAKIVEMFRSYEPLGKRFQPTPKLLQWASGNRRIYD